MTVRMRYLLGTTLATGVAVIAGFSLATGSGGSPPVPATQIQHLVVIFDENESFDHYFGTYPNATNPAGEPQVTAGPGATPAIDGLSNALLTTNPNTPVGGRNDANPHRLPRTMTIPCGQSHDYGQEQKAFDHGAMDAFPANTGGCADKNVVMDYYDGNTVTALWNVAQHYAMSDNYFASTFGPSTPGALNLIAGQTHGVTLAAAGADGTGTMTGDPNPILEDCGAGNGQFTGVQNIGDLLNAADATWGWFQGGFKPTSTAGGIATCGATHANLGGGSPPDYSAHHEPFQYFASTANPHHLRPTSVANIGKTDRANHQYDLSDFDAAVANGTLPQVSFLKPASFEDAHPGNSGPLDEQRWIARVLDEVQQSPDWAHTAVVITYDDSDGWYDHRTVGPFQKSNTVSDHLNGDGHCGATDPAVGDYLDRCGPGPRLPLLVMSPWAKQNYVDHTQLEQTSIIRFIEDNWLRGARLGNQSFDARAANHGLEHLFDFAGAGNAPKLFLNPATGTVLRSAPSGVLAAPGGATSGFKVNPVAKAKFVVTGKRSGKTLTLSFGVTGVSTNYGKITVALKFLQGRKTIASAKGTVKSGKVKLTAKAKSAIKKGTYTVRLTVTQAKKSKTLSKSLKLK